MKYADLLIRRDSGDLKMALDALSVYWYSIPTPERPGGDIGKLAADVLSYRRKLDDIPDEYKSTLWASVNYLLEKMAKVDVDKMIDDSKVVRNVTALTPGKYWIVDGKFHRCDGEFKDFILDNQPLFTESLGIDAWRMLRSRHSHVDDIVRLVLMSGATACIIGKREGMKYARYQCCQDALPALKKLSSKMAIKTSFFRIYDPSKPYSGFSSGILFVIRH